MDAVVSQPKRATQQALRVLRAVKADYAVRAEIGDVLPVGCELVKLDKIPVRKSPSISNAEQSCNFRGIFVISVPGRMSISASGNTTAASAFHDAEKKPEKQERMNAYSAGNFHGGYFRIVPLSVLWGGTSKSCCGC